MNLPTTPQRYDASMEAIRSRIIEDADAQNFKRQQNLDLVSGAKLYLHSPNGTGYYLTVDNTGALGTNGHPGGGGYVLPPATASVLGGVKIGAGISVAGDGTISAAGAAQTPWTSDIDAAGHKLTNTGNVGIGTATPGYPLQIHIGTNINAIFSAGTTLSSAASLSAANDAISANVGLELRGSPIVMSGGNVGIGTAAPRGPLSVMTASAPTTAAAANQITIGEPSNNSAYGVAVGLFNDGTYYRGVIQATNNGPALGSLLLQPSGGNVGIGVLNPLNILSVMAPANPTTAAAANQITIGEVSNNSAYRLNLGFYQGAQYIGVIQATNGGPAGGILALQPSGGNVGIGTTTPAYQLQLSTDSAAKPTTSAWTIASDARLKRNVRPLEGGLDVIRRLRLIEAEYNGADGTPKGRRVVSFLADQVREVLPGCVTSHKGRLDGKRTEILDLNIHEILMHMILAVQQLEKGQTNG